MAGWIAYPAQSPAELVLYVGQQLGSSRDCSLHDDGGVVDDQQCPTRRARDRRRSQPLPARLRACDPEPRIPDLQLGHDVLAIADLVQDHRVECPPIERDRFSTAINPQLRLDPTNPDSR